MAKKPKKALNDNLITEAHTFKGLTLNREVFWENQVKLPIHIYHTMKPFIPRIFRVEKATLISRYKNITMRIYKAFNFGFLIFIMMSCQTKKTEKARFMDKTVPEKQEKKINLEKTVWASNGIYSPEGDSLIFKSDKKVRLYLGDLGFDFDSEYKISNDTLIIETILAAFEMNNISGLKPDLIQKYLITKDSLQLLYLANRRNNKWEKADTNRVKQISNYYKIK